MLTTVIKIGLKSVVYKMYTTLNVFNVYLLVCKLVLLVIE